MIQTYPEGLDFSQTSFNFVACAQIRSFKTSGVLQSEGENIFFDAI